MVFDYIHLNHSWIATHLLEPLHNLYESRHDDNNPPDDELMDRILKRIVHYWNTLNVTFDSFRLVMLKIFLDEQMDPVIFYKALFLYYDSIKDDPDKKQEAHQIDNLQKGIMKDLTIILTYYTIMSCEIYNMDNTEDLDNIDK